MSVKLYKYFGAILMAAAVTCGGTAHAQADKPNIVFIMGDDIGMWNIGAYHRGLMAGRTPNIDRIAAGGTTGTVTVTAVQDEKAPSSPTITRKQAARRAARTSLRASYQYAPD